MSAEGHSEAGKETTFISQVIPFLTNWPQSHHHQLELFLIIHLLFGGTKLNLSTRCLEGLNSVYPLAVSGQACKMINVVSFPASEWPSALILSELFLLKIDDVRFSQFYEVKVSKFFSFIFLMNFVGVWQPWKFTNQSRKRRLRST